MTAISGLTLLAYREGRIFSPQLSLCQTILDVHHHLMWVLIIIAMLLLLLHGSLQWYTNNTLWDGKDCYLGSNCCNNARLPWFWKTLKQETSNDITVRWCSSSRKRSIGFATELLEIYVY